MKKGVNYLFSIHRITGCIIAGFFLMWFVTGLILIYHPYPRLTDEQLYEKKEILPSLLPDIQSIKQKAGENIKQLHIRQSQGQTLATVTTADSCFTYCCNDTTVAVKPITFSFLEETALKWVNAPVIKVDTLHERVQWILYSRYDRAMPIYKFYFDDPEKHELFISGKTGEVQQLTDKSQRLWAWLGAIPHKFYLPFIRKNLDLWDTSITIGGLLCFITSLTGAFVGIYVLLKRHKQKKKWEIPYRKRWYRLHHITGLLFGLFLIAWGISGMISMQRIPQWLINTNGNYIFNSSRMWGKKPLPIDTYELDYRQLKTAYPDLKEVSWTHFRNIPVYTVIVGNRELQIDASTPEIKKLFIPEQTIIEGIQEVHGKNVNFQISLLDTYDNYYLSRTESLPLPVYRVVIDDDISSRYYISPETGYIRYLNKNKMAKKWLFSGIHYLNIQWLLERPMLWTISLWVLCLGSAFVCLTGCWLGTKFIKRYITKRGYDKNRLQ